MGSWLLAGAIGIYALLFARSIWRRDLSGGPYRSPDAAEAEIEELAGRHPTLCSLETLGRSREGRPLRALWLRAGTGAPERPRLLVTAHIHAVEYIGGHVARAVATRLADGYGRDGEVTALLDAAEVCIVPLLNPDGAARVWRRGGWSNWGDARFTAGGVDPNRNFPRLDLPGARAWNSGRDRPGSAHYRGPHPLSEPECLALARLCRRERFCGAIHFHSFGCVVYMPEVSESQGSLRSALDVFRGAFQSRQERVRYRPVPERASAIDGQLDAFLVGAYGTPSVTVEVGRPGVAFLRPDRIFNIFWLANAGHPDRWAQNDVGATIFALTELLARTGGVPGDPTQPELAESVEKLEALSGSAAPAAPSSSPPSR